jgi:GntR family transcriptional regulator / MocR family aminotransferase
MQLDGQGPRYAQITRALTSQIHSGALSPGARLPATRELARDLGCSRNTVLLAYEQLTLEGYLVTRSGGGTFVSPSLPVTPATEVRTDDLVELAKGMARLSPNGRRIAEVGDQTRRMTLRRHGAGIDFMVGLCDPDDRLVGRIRAAFAAALRTRPFYYPESMGERQLRQQVAERLRGTRRITRGPDQILITSGTQQTLEICARLFIGEGDRVIVEDPCYEVPPAQFQAAGAEVLRIPVDRHGLDVDALPDDGRPARLAYVTPSHQYPTGAVMSTARRHALLAWAKRQGALILEDDYDGEFRYAGPRRDALAALDTDGLVIYCGTFAKSLFPAMRLAYMALPPDLMPAAHACKWMTDRGSPVLTQRTLGELMATGEYDRHIRRMQRRYRSRCAALVSAIETHFGSAAIVEGSDAGMHIVVWLPHLPTDRVDDLVAACQARDVAVYSVARYAARPLRRPGLMLGYGLIDIDDIRRGIKRLSDAYAEVTCVTRGEGSRRDRRGPRGAPADTSRARPRGPASPRRERA